MANFVQIVGSRWTPTIVGRTSEATNNLVESGRSIYRLRSKGTTIPDTRLMPPGETVRIRRSLMQAGVMPGKVSIWDV